MRKKKYHLGNLKGVRLKVIRVESSGEGGAGGDIKVWRCADPMEGSFQRRGEPNWIFKSSSFRKEGWLNCLEQGRGRWRSNAASRALFVWKEILKHVPYSGHDRGCLTTLIVFLT